MRRRLYDLGGRDPYELLGVDPDATAAEIVAAHRRRVREVHPDRPGGDEEATKLLHVARDVLLDDEERASYDRLRAEGLDPLTDAPPASSAWDSEDVVDSAMPPPPPAPPPWTPPRRPPPWVPPPRMAPPPPFHPPPFHPPPFHPPQFPPPVPPAYASPPAWMPPPPVPRPAPSGLPLGVWAVILSFLCSPIGLIPGIIALSRRPPSGSADKICAIVAICWGAAGLLTCSLWVLVAITAP